LTLHGGSGTDDEDLRKAIGAGINIVHINTELRVAWRRGLEEGLRKEPDEVVPYKILPFAVQSVEEVARSRLAFFNALTRRVDAHELNRSRGRGGRVRLEEGEG
jgi:fructose/tagatose bisphosphate aldolase